jgi:hypothetical protein
MKRSTHFRLLLCLCAFSVAVLFAPDGVSVPAATKPLSAYDDQVRELMSKMTLDEKIGQMTQPDQQFLKDIGDIQKYHVGSLLSGGDSDPKAGNTLEDWTEMVDRYQLEALIGIHEGDPGYSPLFPYGYGLTY